MFVLAGLDQMLECDNKSLTLGALIALFEKCSPYAHVQYDFGYMYPKGLHSWRGIYAWLALGYEAGYAEVTVATVLVELKSAVGKTFHGYKGGEYVMGPDTPVWVSNEREACDTIITGLTPIHGGTTIVINTAYGSV